ncbi:vesicular inhibitory amino acid transporter-like [Strongylocentrotus purpuratus]|uniref:Amino acid transporter transmembrane domain-containing protein n=1 Tax=Strongylocentrotus purpuratus TaxID=7668 RepID=A0A7M7NVD3_STRPU|nr:vesicular inhibitory amino acid transporter-like [Strongylocentrotus purpuratus]
MDNLRAVRSKLLTRLASTGLIRHPGNGEDIELCPKDQVVTREYTNDLTSPDDTPDAETPSGSASHTLFDGSVFGASTESDLRQMDEDSETDKSSVLQACWNVSNSMQGIGILSLPYTVKEGGVAVLVAIVVILILLNYTSKIIVYCKYDDEDDDDNGSTRIDTDRKAALASDRPQVVRETYADIADTCFKHGGHVINVLLIIDMMTVAALYLQLSGALLVDTFPQAGLNRFTWTALIVVVLLPTVLFKNLTKISWLSLVALIALAVMYCSVVWYSFGRSIRWKMESIPPFFIEPVAISVAMLSLNFGAHLFMPGVEGSMREPSRFNVMLNYSYIVTGFINVAYALFAFLAFEEDTQEFITYNMPRGPLQAAVSCLFVIKSILTYPLMIFLIVSTIDYMKLSFLSRCYPDIAERCPPIWAIIFRVLLVGLSYLMAVAIPHFSLLMGVTGSLTAPWLDYIFPCLFYLKLRKRSIRMLEKAYLWFIIMLGGLAGLVGLFYSCKAMIRALGGDINNEW